MKIILKQLNEFKEPNILIQHSYHSYLIFKYLFEYEYQNKILTETLYEEIFKM